MAGFCITNEDAVTEACKQEVIRRYLNARCDVRLGKCSEQVVEKIELIMRQIGTNVRDRKIVEVALEKEKEKKTPVVAIELHDGVIITGKQTDLLTATSSMILNTIKYMAGITDKLKLVSPNIIKPIQNLKRNVLNLENVRLNAQDLLTALSINATTNSIVEDALSMISGLEKAEVHSTTMLPYEDLQVLKELKINVTTEPVIKNN